MKHVKASNEVWSGSHVSTMGSLELVLSIKPIGSLASPLLAGSPSCVKLLKLSTTLDKADVTPLKQEIAVAHLLRHLLSVIG